MAAAIVCTQDTEKNTHTFLVSHSPTLHCAVTDTSTHSSWHPVALVFPPTHPGPVATGHAHGTGSSLASACGPKQAITSLQRQLALQPTKHRPLSRIPTSTAPEKCEAEIYTSTFRPWSCSMECLLQLNAWALHDRGSLAHPSLLHPSPVALPGRQVFEGTVASVVHRSSLEYHRRIVFQAAY